MKNILNRKYGYTLLEILIVIAIIGILTALGSITYSQLSKQSRDARRKTDLENIRTALEMYRSNSATAIYPATSPISTTCVSDTMSCSAASYNIMYLQKVPTDPKNTYIYYYAQLSSGSSYDLCAKLEIAGSSSVGDCESTAGTQVCNYCVGPYGVK